MVKQVAKAEKKAAKAEAKVDTAAAKCSADKAVAAITGKANAKADPTAAADSESGSDEDEAEETYTQIPAHQRKKKRLSIPENLPSTDIIHDLPEEEKFCPHDKHALRHFGDECSKQLDYIPAKITVLNHVRRKYMCPCCNDYFVTAKKTAQPIEKSIASPGLLSQIVTHKYCDGLPLYRQSNLL